MKKALPVVVVLALIAAALVYFLKEPVALDLAPGRAAEMAPADTVVFIEFPDLARSKARWKDTSLHKISEEPEWKAFTAKWDEFTAQNPQMREANGIMDQIERADPAGLFVAISAFDGTVPKLVAGFPYRGKKSDVQAVVSNFRKRILDAYPAAKAGDLANYEGTEIETLKDKDITISMAYRDNWFLFATDNELLLKTLSRYIRKPDAPASLASDPLWQATIRNGTPNPDMTLFLRWAPIAKKFEELAVLAAPGQAFPTNPNNMESILYSAKMDGLLMRDHFYMRAGKVPKLEPLANRSAAFTSAATYLYLASQVAMLTEPMKEAIEAIEKSPQTAGLSTWLAKKGLKIEDFFTTFGPEIGVVSDWESGALGMPSLFAAVEVRDKAKARLFADLISGELGSTEKVVISQEEGTTFWTMPGDVPLFQPTVALNDQHLAAGLNFATVKAALKQAKAGAADVPGRGDYQAALKTVGRPEAAVLFLDFKTLFERLYEKLKPMAAYAIVGQPELAKYVDPAKLPKAETISKHLLPMLISWTEAEGGMQMECTGSVSLIQSYVPIVGGGTFLLFTRPSPARPLPPPPAPPVPATKP